MPRTRTKRKVANKAVLRGKGDYSQAITSMPAGMNRLESKIDHLEKSLVKTTPTIKGAAATIGRTLGNFVNQGDLGALAGSSLAKLFGHGDYTVKSNSLMGGRVGPTLPKFDKDGRRGTRIVEREYIGEVTAAGYLVNGSSAFYNRVLPINVTNSETFPWLSTIAQQYDQWEPHGIVFEFVSTSSSYNGVSQALGTVIMATDYDITDPAYSNKQNMENSDYACSTRPAENLIHGIECDPDERPVKILYTGSNQVSLSMLANFQIATIGCSTANVVLGELWISYDITFYKKQLIDPVKSRPYLTTYGTSASGVGYFANVFDPEGNNIHITQNVGVGSVINFPSFQSEGYYLMTLRNDTTTYNNTYTFTNCTKVAEFNCNEAGVKNTFAFCIRIDALNAKITTALTTSAKGWFLSIVPVAQQLWL